MKYLSILFCVLSLSGCVSTLDNMAGLGQITESNDTFNNSRVVEVSPTWLSGETDRDFASSKMGARWNSARPDSLQLIFKFDGSLRDSTTYLTYTDLIVKIDGETRSFRFSTTNHNSTDYNEVSRDIYTESTARVTVPMSFAKAMLEADDVRMRLEYYSTYEDVVFHREVAGTGHILAKAKIKELLTRI